MAFKRQQLMSSKVRSANMLAHPGAFHFRPAVKFA